MTVKANPRRISFCLVSAIVLFCTSGCDEPAGPTVSAKGTVTVGGEPLSGAVLTLEPISPTTGPNVSVPVFNGKFEVTPEAGLHGGIYAVRVSMIPAEIRKSIPVEQARLLPADDVMIAPEFDTDSKSTCELKLNQENAFAFAVEFL